MEIAKMLNTTILACLLILTGCLGLFDDDDVIDDADGESTPDDTGTEQERIWFSSAGEFKSNWNYTGYDNSGYNQASDTHLSDLSDWDTTECTDAGGIPTGSEEEYDWDPTAPMCKQIFTTISTSSGEALLIYDLSQVSITTTCNGISIGGVSDSVYKEYVVAPGSAMDCTHELSGWTNYRYSGQDASDVRVWSVVYAIQNVIVV
jgi:hypothetical protein